MTRTHRFFVRMLASRRLMRAGWVIVRTVNRAGGRARYAATVCGGCAASSFVIADPLPANTDFKVGSVTSSLGTTGLTVAVAYSNNGGSTWVYTPASGGGGAPSGYDRSVTNVRWIFTGNLSQTSPNNTGSVSFVSRIR